MALLPRVLHWAYEADTLSGSPLYYSTIQRNNRRLLVLLHTNPQLKRATDWSSSRFHYSIIKLWTLYRWICYNSKKTLVLIYKTKKK